MYFNIKFILFCLCRLFLLSEMKKEFKRFGLEKIGLLTIILQFIGATGLIVGLKFNPILTISSLGLTLLMLSGLIVRIKLKDSIWISLPALFYLVVEYLYLFDINKLIDHQEL